MNEKELNERYTLDIEVLKKEKYITDDMTNEQKHKMIRLNQQYSLCEDGIENMSKRVYMQQNPDVYEKEFRLITKSVYFEHCGIVGQGFIMSISRWYDRMYRIYSTYFEKPYSVHHEHIYLTLEELFEALNNKYTIKRNRNE